MFTFTTGCTWRRSSPHRRGTASRPSSTRVRDGRRHRPKRISQQRHGQRWRNRLQTVFAPHISRRRSVPAIADNAVRVPLSTRRARFSRKVYATIIGYNPRETARDRDPLRLRGREECADALCSCCCTGIVPGGRRRYCSAGSTVPGAAPRRPYEARPWPPDQRAALKPIATSPSRHVSGPERLGQTFIPADLGSRNGTWLNGQGDRRPGPCCKTETSDQASATPRCASARPAQHKRSVHQALQSLAHRPEPSSVLLAP